MKKISALFATVFCLCLFLTGCSKNASPSALLSDDGREMASIALDLTVQDLSNGMDSQTRGPKVDTLTHSESTAIKNLWILQFDGTSEDANIIFCKYYDDYSAMPSYIDVISSGGSDNRLYFIANTFDPNIAFGSVRTIAQVRNVFMSFTNEWSIVCTEEISGQTVHYLPMNGYVDGPIGTGTVSCELERCVARIDCNVKCTVPGMTVQDITICNVPMEVPCLTKGYVSTLATFPSEASLNVMDYTPTSWSEGAVMQADNDVRQFSFYVPCNKRGTTGNTSAKLKASSAPVKATYARVTTTYQLDGETRHAYYSFYLGANLTNDFNVLPNHKYTYNLVIDEMGDQFTDGRVTLDIVDYRSKPLANCYMLQPPIDKSWRTFRIPIRRLNTFWKDYAGDLTNAMESDQTPGWQVDILWSDTPLNIAGENQARADVANCNFKWRKASKKYLRGTGEQVDVLHDYFEFEISSAIQRANFVIGIRRFSDDDCTQLDQGFLWSWHMWVTDYQPSKCVGFSPVVDPATGDETKFVYAVPGGAVHRYLGAIWNNNTGTYKGKYIMDRNLGAKLVNVYNGSNECYYQFGRKDPFYGGTLYNTTIHSKTTIPYNGTGSSNNVNYSVNRPLAFVTGSDWTNNATTFAGNKYNNTSFYWQDQETVGSVSKKSIFDPCPAGWRVPFNGTWADFGVTATTRFKWGDPIANGRTYLPTGISGIIYYPASGHLGSGDGVSGSVGSTGPYWSCSPSSASYGYFLYFFTGGALPSIDYYYRAYGFPVRCVQE